MNVTITNICTAMSISTNTTTSMPTGAKYIPILIHTAMRTTINTAATPQKRTIWWITSMIIITGNRNCLITTIPTDH